MPFMFSKINKGKIMIEKKWAGKRQSVIDRRLHIYQYASRPEGFAYPDLPYPRGTAKFDVQAMLKDGSIFRMKPMGTRHDGTRYFSTKEAAEKYKENFVLVKKQIPNKYNSYKGAGPANISGDLIITDKTIYTVAPPIKDAFYTNTYQRW